MPSTTAGESALLSLRAGVPGATHAGVTRLPGTERKVVLVSVDEGVRRGALGAADSETVAEAAAMALAQRLPLVVVVASSGADIHEGVASLHGWGRAARALSSCSGIVPVVLMTYGLAVSGPALLLGMADAVVMTDEAVAYVSGPAAVREWTGQLIHPDELGGPRVHTRSSGVATLVAPDHEAALAMVASLIDYLPDHTDEEAPAWASDDPWDRPTPELRDLLPTSDTGSYDVRRVVAAVADDGEYLELRATWSPQLVTALCRVEGRPVGVLANQPQSMAGTLDISASQKGARFVSFCDSFNIPLLTMVDTPGFMPGKDLEWRGMIRHGAQLVFAYAEATVPRVCLILRKAFGGAYIVMDSKGMGNDICLAWPSAQVAVMGAQGAVQILHRREDAETRGRLQVEYEERYLNPYVAAERGFVDGVIDPAESRRSVAASLRLLSSKRERLIARKHGNGPM
ncbi:MAG TPA: carboxyl transferase domain-containing protein [Acidimicrobiales bacterium]|nr:carboxyl transferase domain-containing protein [Acidimicrobiales bacterium]